MTGCVGPGLSGVPRSPFGSHWCVTVLGGWRRRWVGPFLPGNAHKSRYRAGGGALCPCSAGRCPRAGPCPWPGARAELLSPSPGHPRAARGPRLLRGASPASLRHRGQAGQCLGPSAGGLTSSHASPFGGQGLRPSRPHDFLGPGLCWEMSPVGIQGGAYGSPGGRGSLGSQRPGTCYRTVGSAQREPLPSERRSSAQSGLMPRPSPGRPRPGAGDRPH